MIVVHIDVSIINWYCSGTDFGHLS